ncbi:unnamed protein product [Coccothraustes coccothraustes]
MGAAAALRRGTGWLRGEAGPGRGTAPAIHALVRSRAPPAPEPPRGSRSPGTSGARGRDPPEPGNCRLPRAAPGQTRPPTPCGNGTSSPAAVPLRLLAAGAGSPRPRRGNGCAEVTPSRRAALAQGSSCGRTCSGANEEPGTVALFKTP